jgi:hypothetical protein
MVISNINYNARGQRVLYDYSDPTVTPPPASPATTCEVTYQYDPFTFRLTNLTTNRVASGAVTAAVLQDLLYTYDPVGNVVETDDNADPRPSSPRRSRWSRPRASTATTRFTASSPPRGASTRGSSSRPGRSTSFPQTSPLTPAMCRRWSSTSRTTPTTRSATSRRSCTRRLVPRRA